MNELYAYCVEAGVEPSTGGMAVVWLINKVEAFVQKTKQFFSK